MLNNGNEKVLDGVTPNQLFSHGHGYTFDDINILPPFSSISGQSPALLTRLSPNLGLKLAIVSSPMDSVTEWRTAVAMALEGGLGVIHFNLNSQEQAEQVQKVKRSQMGFIPSPVCRKPTDPISEVYAIKEEYGFSTVLITEDGTQTSRLLGMVMKGNVSFIIDRNSPIQEAMIPLSELTTRLASEVKDITSARQILRENRSASKLPLLNPDGSVHALVTREDVYKSSKFPNALLDQNEQLIVGAAVSTHEEDFDRVGVLLRAGVDVLVIDAAQGGTKFAVDMIRYIRRRNPTITIIGGNVVTSAQAEPLISAGVNALRVGMGSGSICTTQEVIGVGSSQLRAVYTVASLAAKSGVAVISDGGIRTTADMLKAFVCGADAVMLGSYIAGCQETPAEEKTREDGGRLKLYRGMGSPAAIREGGEKRYGQSFDSSSVVPQGIERWITFKGSLHDVLQKQTIPYLIKGLEYLGCESIAHIHKRVNKGEIVLQIRSSAAREEGRPRS